MRWRRKRSVVSPSRQFWFGLELVAVSIGFNLLCFFFMFLSPVSEFFGGESEDFLSSFLEIIYLKWPLILVSMVVLLFIGVLMSHRLYGPILGIQNVLRDWMAGNKDARLRIRKFDYLLPLMEPMNDLLNSQQAINSKAAELAQAVQSGSDLSSLKQTSQELLEVLGQHES